MLKLLDFFFTGFHTILIIFNLFGWLVPSLRKLNLMVLIITAGSWFILGIFYGIGYCPLTEWHFQVLQKLGYSDLPNSYVTFLVKRLTGFTLDQNLVDTLTMVCFFVAFGLSLFVNLRFRKSKSTVI